MRGRRGPGRIAAILLLVAGAGCRDAPSAVTAGETVIDLARARDAGRIATELPPSADAAPAVDATTASGPGACLGALPADPCSASGADCRPTWAAVLGDPICRAVAGDPRARESRGRCGAYDVSWITYPDTSVAYYYDHLTGRLAAIYAVTLSKLVQTCTAGPPDDIAATCRQSLSLTAVCPADG